MMGIKAQMLHQAVFLDQVDNQKRDKAKEIDFYTFSYLSNIS